MAIVKVLKILNEHILKLEQESQLKDWEIERLKEELKSYQGREYEKE